MGNFVKHVAIDIFLNICVLVVIVLLYVLYAEVQSLKQRSANGCKGSRVGENKKYIGVVTLMHERICEPVVTEERLVRK